MQSEQLERRWIVYRLAWAVLILWAVVPVMTVAILVTPIAGVLPMFGWRNYPLYVRRYEKMGSPWWLPRPTHEARGKLVRMEAEKRMATSEAAQPPIGTKG